MPPLLLGLPGDNTFSNYAEANRAFWRQTVLPLVARVQKSFQAWLQPGFGSFRLDYNADRLEALASERAAEWERVGKAAFLTLDEQREALGYGPAPKEAFVAKRDVGLERRYNPDQPRVPAGNSGGGRWTGDGGGGGFSGSVGLLDDSLSFSDDLGANPTIQQIADNQLVDLRDEEGGVHEGHSIRDHVGKTDNQLRDRIRDSYEEHGWLWVERDTRAGSFPSIHAANKLVNSVIARNFRTVEDVISGRITRRIRFDASFESATGREAYSLDPWKRNATIFFRDTFGGDVPVNVEKGGAALLALSR